MAFMAGGPGRPGTTSTVGSSPTSMMHAKPYSPAFKYRPAKSISFAASGHDSKAIQKKLEHGWRAHERTEALQRKVQEYALMHGCRPKDLKNPVLFGRDTAASTGMPGNQAEKKKEEQSEELQILAKVVQDGEDATKMSAAERAVADYLKTGLRDFIDDALDEVGRYSQLANPVGGRKNPSFNWTGAGHHSDIPILRGSMGNNAVTDGWPDREEDDVLERPRPEDDDEVPRPKGAFSMDFVHDFSQSETRWFQANKARLNRAQTLANPWRPRNADAPTMSFEGIRATTSAGRAEVVRGRWSGQDDDEFAMTASRWVVPNKQPRFTNI